MKYTGNGTGRLLHVPGIDGKYYFHYGYRFVTDSTNRGFDCTTYIGAIDGVDAHANGKEPLSGYGTSLADYLGATKRDMEGKPAAVNPRRREPGYWPPAFSS